jgi:hypothetical protein
VQFQNKGEITENVCCCKELTEMKKGQDILNILSSYLESCGLSWSQCAGFYTNGVPSMMGSTKTLCYTCQRRGS